MNPSLLKIEQKIVALTEASTIVKAWQDEGKKVVFTNGCFDLLHKGHLHYLSEAADLGDKLVLGLNADSSVRALKGASRPVNDEKSRATLLASLFFIDLVVIFDEPTPEVLIKTLTPNVLVKGGDYSIDQIVGAQHVIDNGGKVLSLSFVLGFSSTDLINKIKEAT